MIIYLRLLLERVKTERRMSKTSTMEAINATAVALAM